jgi:plastocyanin
MQMQRNRWTSWILGLSLIVVGCSGGGNSSSGGGTPTAPDSGSSSGDVVEVSIVDYAFQPKQVKVQPGQTVRWVMNASDTTHTTMALDGTWNSGAVFKNSGDSFEHTFTAADDGKTFEYRCVSHYVCCMMQGSVQVGDSAPSPDPGYGN